MGKKLENKFRVSVTLPLRDSTLAHIPMNTDLIKEELYYLVTCSLKKLISIK